MVYKFRLLSDEVDDFRRDIEIDSDATFFELHKAILESVNYPDDQMTSFFICNDQWIKEVEITREDMGSMSEDENYIMAETVIGDLVEDEKQTLDFEEIMSKSPAVAANDEFSEDFYGSDEYNDDDLDPDGFDMGNISDMSSIDDLY